MRVGEHPRRHAHLQADKICGPDRAARAGVVFLTKTVATEWAPLGIRVNCVAPGTIRTEGFGNYSDAGRATFNQANPMLRAGHPWDIAEAIAYLSSDAANFITGETLNVDGGGQNWGDPWFVGRPPYFELDYGASRMPVTDQEIAQ